MTFMQLPIADLELGLDFRLDDDGESLGELAASIADVGVLQPLMVRRVADRWEVVAGRRRLAAARIAGLDEVPCIHRELTDDQAADVALTENLHRRDLSPIEIALALARLRDQGLTQRAIAARIGRSDFYVSVLLRLLEMPQAIQQKVHAGKMSYSTAYDHWKREARPGGPRHRSSPSMDGETAGLVTHWRRRHDRLLAGIAQILKNRPADGYEFRQQLERLFALDRKPLPEEPVKGRVAA
jgi:ParB/RepB/Spo0J family partition protein